MKVTDIVESFDPIPCMDVNALLSKIMSSYSNYPKNSLTPREVVTEMYINDVSKEEAEKICSDLTKEITATISKFHEQLAKKKKTAIK